MHRYYPSFLSLTMPCLYKQTRVVLNQNNKEKLAYHNRRLLYLDPSSTHCSPFLSKICRPCSCNNCHYSDPFPSRNSRNSAHRYNRALSCRTSTNYYNKTPSLHRFCIMTPPADNTDSHPYIASTHTTRRPYFGWHYHNLDSTRATFSDPFWLRHIFPGHIRRDRDYCTKYRDHLRWRNCSVSPKD